MKQIVFSSALSPVEAASRLRTACRPWSQLDCWTARKTFFFREKGGQFWVVRTGNIMGRVCGLLTFTPQEGGSQVAARLWVPRTGFAIFLGFTFCSIVLTVLDLMNHRFVLWEIGKTVILAIGVKLTIATEREIPLLEKFLRQTLAA